VRVLALRGGLSTVVVVCLGFLVACDAPEASTDAAHRVAERAAGAWSLVAITTDTVVLVPGDARISVSLEDGHAHGWTGCNTLRFAYETDGTSFSVIGGIATTRRLCRDEDVRVLEQRLLRALGAAASVVENDGRLTVSGSFGSLEFVREEADPPS
jgi:heat shock protein HslJ